MLDFTGEHIKKLSQADLRTLVTKLCEAEAQKNRLPISGITDGGNDSDSDGGVDVYAEFPDGMHGGLDFMPRAINGFQAKCADIKPGQITTEMRPNGVLRQSIIDLANNKGAYIIVRSKGSCSYRVLKSRIEAMRQAVSDLENSKDLRLEFYDCKRLARWVSEYPGVEMWARDKIGEPLEGWRGHGSWSRSPGDFFVDSSGIVIERMSDNGNELCAEAGIDFIRGILKKSGQCVRLVGLSGVGKSRFAQALFEHGIGNEAPLDAALAVYTDLGDSPNPSAHDMLQKLGRTEKRTILVVDNCNPKVHRSLAKLVVDEFPQHISLLTIEYDVMDDEDYEETHILELSASSADVLDRIIAAKAPHVGMLDREKIIEFAEGNAQVALALTETVKKGSSLGVLKNSDFINRILLQGKPHEQDILPIARVCALVYSFDFEKSNSGEDLSEVSLLASLADCHINSFERFVRRLAHRKVIQSRGRWRALLPHAIANKLAKDALVEYSPEAIATIFEKNRRLFRSFTRRLSFLHDSAEVCQFAEHWIRDGAWLISEIRKNPYTFDAFFNLANLAPEKALEAVRQIVDSFEGIDGLLGRSSCRPWVSLVKKSPMRSDSLKNLQTLF